MTQDKLVEFCKDMGFANETAAIKLNLVEMWTHLKGNEKESVSVYNVKVFLSAIMNFNHPWMKSSMTEEKKKVNTNALGVFTEEGKMELSDEEITWIGKHFVLM